MYERPSLKRVLLIAAASILFSAAGPGALWGQDPNSGALAVSFSDPARPGLLKVNLSFGSMSVKAYDGKTVIVSSVPTPSSNGRGSRPGRGPESAETEGLRRLEPLASGIVIDEANNTMTISSRQSWPWANVVVQVPQRTNLQLRASNGSIGVEGVDGDIEISNENGSVTVADVSGSVVAYSRNGSVTATIARVTAQKPMSFISQNGRVDVTFPSDLKANVKLRTDNGSIWTAFDVQVKPNPAPVVQDTRNQGGRFRLETDQSIFGTINGGGPDFTLQSMNGNLFIRKAK